MFEIYRLVIPKRIAKKLERHTKWNSLRERLKTDPHSVGSYTSYTGGKLKETRLGNHRLYFIIVDTKDSVEILCYVHIIGFSHKDEQNGFLRSVSEKIKQAFNQLLLCLFLYPQFPLAAP